MTTSAPALAAPRVDTTRRLTSLAKVRDLLDRDHAAIRKVLTEVGTYAAATYELDAARAALEGAAGEVARHRPPALRASAVFMPSNMLLYSYVLYLLIPSLFVQRLTFRPSSHVREATAALHQRLALAHGLPIELADLSQREFLRDVVTAADLVVFTGRYPNGNEIRSMLSADQLFLYFGQGVNPVVVAPDAELDQALTGVIDIRLFNCGQDCLGPDAIFVHDQVYDRFLDGLVTRLRRLRAGPYTDPNAGYGPLYYDSALEDVARFLHRYRSRITYGGTIDFRTRTVEPTVLVSRLGAEPELTEFFAPVFNVVTYDDTDALRATLTSGVYTDRALGATVYGDGDGSGPLTEALRRRHTVTVNVPLTAVDDGNAPFGGRGHVANYIAYRGRLHAEPILISKAVAEHWRAVR